MRVDWILRQGWIIPSFYFLTVLGDSTNLFKDSANTAVPALDAKLLGGYSSGAQESLLLNDNIDASGLHNTTGLGAHARLSASYKMAIQ